MSTAPFSVGDRVKWSGHEIMRKRDRWLNEGREPMKSRAKQNLEAAVKARGTVLEVSAGKFIPWTVKVQFDGEASIHNSMPYLYEKEGP